MDSSEAYSRWGTLSAIVAGVGTLVPLSFYFFFIPAAGSTGTHAADPASFLPWMAERGTVRVALWWAVCLPFLVALLGAPSALKEVLKTSSPTAARTAELAGILGFFTLVLACLMLAAGEMPLARAYVAAAPDAKQAIAANYEWQRLVTALLFDVLGFFLVGLWIFVSSVAGLRSGSLPQGLGWFGVVTALTFCCFVVGYVSGIHWLGEFGIGALAFITLPAWLIWLGAVLWRRGVAEREAA